jgi:hypothetical protein
MSPSAIGRQMGINESSVRSYLEPGRKEKLDVLQSTAEMLKRQVEEKGFVDVGAQVERDLPLGEKGQSVGISEGQVQHRALYAQGRGLFGSSLKFSRQERERFTRYRLLVKPGVTAEGRLFEPR